MEEYVFSKSKLDMERSGMCPGEDRGGVGMAPVGGPGVQWPRQMLTLGCDLSPQRGLALLGPPSLHPDRLCFPGGEKRRLSSQQMVSP